MNWFSEDSVELDRKGVLLFSWVPSCLQLTTTSSITIKLGKRSKGLQKRTMGKVSPKKRNKDKTWMSWMMMERMTFKKSLQIYRVWGKTFQQLRRRKIRNLPSG